jgi:hypothetical protein
MALLRVRFLFADSFFIIQIAAAQFRSIVPNTDSILRTSLKVDFNRLSVTVCSY